MSRMKSEDEYKKTKAFHFFRWLSGEKDPYMGNLEMKPQEEYITEEASIRERMRESQMVMDKVYNIKCRSFSAAFTGSWRQRFVSCWPVCCCLRFPICRLRATHPILIIMRWPKDI